MRRPDFFKSPDSATEEALQARLKKHLGVESLDKLTLEQVREIHRTLLSMETKVTVQIKVSGNGKSAVLLMSGASPLPQDNIDSRVVNLEDGFGPEYLTNWLIRRELPRNPEELTFAVEKSSAPPSSRAGTIRRKVLSIPTIESELSDVSTYHYLNRDNVNILLPTLLKRFEGATLVLDVYLRSEREPFARLRYGERNGRFVAVNMFDPSGVLSTIVTNVIYFTPLSPSERRTEREKHRGMRVWDINEWLQVQLGRRVRLEDVTFAAFKYRSPEETAPPIEASTEHRGSNAGQTESSKVSAYESEERPQTPGAEFAKILRVTAAERRERRREITEKVKELTEPLKDLPLFITTVDKSTILTFGAYLCTIDGGNLPRVAGTLKDDPESATFTNWLRGAAVMKRSVEAKITISDTLQRITTDNSSNPIVYRVFNETTTLDQILKKLQQFANIVYR